MWMGIPNLNQRPNESSVFLCKGIDKPQSDMIYCGRKDK